jgi:hypothetical protein
MPASVNDLFGATFNNANPNVARVNGTRVPSGSTLSCDNLAGWPTTTKADFSTYKIDTNNAVIAGTQTDWKGVVSGNTISSITRVAGAADTGNAIGDVVEMNPTGTWANDLVNGILVQHTQTGAHHDITSTNATITNATITNLTVGGQTPSPDWTTLATPPNTVTYNGQRSYSLVFNGVDYTNILSPGQRLKTTRTVAAPTQSTSLNGTTQYWSKTSPNKLTFTDNFTLSAWVKLTNYATGVIVSKTSSSSDGFKLYINSTGQVVLTGQNASSTYRSVTSTQTIPLNKWIHIAASLVMSTSTGVIYLDGVVVPSLVSGTATSLVSAGNLYIGGDVGPSNYFPGEIAQAAVFDAVLSAATIQSYYSQGLSGSETNLKSAYSFNGVATDLNTTTPNDLTAQASAGYVADSPFGTQGSGLISSTLDYGVVITAVYSGGNTTVTAQVPAGCTIPTSGGVSAVSYSGVAVPYGFPDVSSFMLTAYNTTTTNAIANSIAKYITPKSLAVTYQNTGSAAGWLFMQQLADEKIVRGLTAIVTAPATNNVSYVINLPPNFFASITTTVHHIHAATGNTNVFAIGLTITTASNTFAIQNNSSGAAGGIVASTITGN